MGRNMNPAKLGVAIDSCRGDEKKVDSLIDEMLKPHYVGKTDYVGPFSARTTCMETGLPLYDRQ